VTIDVVARPLVPLPRKSTLFVRDPELGWRLRPSAEDEWDGVPVTVNAKGLRGPEVDYARRQGAARILHLGDSVTVGYGLASHAASYPYLTAERLQRMGGPPIETVNGAVNGYSTWQEVGWLEREGIRYHPDLVVLGFVLNDVAGEGADDPQRRLLEFARRLGVPALDLLPVLRARAQADGFPPADYFLDDDHPSPMGSLVVADRLAEFIVAEGLLPGWP
jgi:lysophospholipase L1-like esterase